MSKCGLHIYIVVSDDTENEIGRFEVWEPLNRKDFMEILMRMGIGFKIAQEFTEDIYENKDAPKCT